MSEIKSWDQLFLNMAFMIALKSKDPSTKTGCIIVDKNHRVRSMGFNGFPSGVIDTTPERYERPIKYSWTEHCERNAIFSAARIGVSLDGCTSYQTGPSCHECARAHIQAGIKEVVWPIDCDFESPRVWPRWKESCELAWEMFDEAGVIWRRGVDKQEK